MKSLKLRIVVTFTLALIGISLALLWISAAITRRVIAEFFEGSMQLELQRAQSIFETGGSARLAAHRAETNASLAGTLYLTDASGRDLVPRADCSRVLP